LWLAIVTLIVGWRLMEAQETIENSQPTEIPAESEAATDPVAEAGLTANEANQHFLEKVLPLLKSRCISCHGPDKVEGSLRLDSREAVLAGG
ncbi:c-type cytochrome domain-containing protein, partial [Acinetobacter baumannii]